MVGIGGDTGAQIDMGDAKLVPEPATLLLLAGGLLTISHKRRNAA